MKSLLKLSVFLVCASVVLHATPKEFTVLGGQKITCEVDGQTPSLAKADGIKLRQPAFVAREGEFAYQFSLDASSNVSKVIVEDVSDAIAHVVLQDSSPKLENGYWMEVSAPLELSKQSIPWIFTRGDSTRVYRFSVSIRGASAPVVLYQPVIWKSPAKKYLKRLAK